MKADLYSDKIEILSTDDEKIKFLGELLTNDSSRAILNLIFEQDMTALDIAKKTGLSLELVRYHIQKMLDIGMAKISKTEKNTREQEMKYYRVTKIVVIVLPQQISEKAKKSKSLINSLNRIYRFAAIGIAGLVSWFTSQTIQNFTQSMTSTNVPPETQGIQEGTFWSIIISLVVIIAGLIVERTFKTYRH